MKSAKRQWRRAGAASWCGVLACGLAWGQTTTVWKSPVSGDYGDASMWSNGAPISTEFDALIGPTETAQAYSIIARGSLDVGNLTIGDSAATFWFLGNSFNAARGIAVEAGSAEFAPMGTITAPSIDVATGAHLRLGSSLDMDLYVGKIGGAVTADSRLLIHDGLTLADADLTLSQGAVLVGGGALSGGGQITITGQWPERSLKSSDGSPVIIGSGVAITAAFGTTVRMPGFINYGSILLDQKNEGTFYLTGTNHGTIELNRGRGSFYISGVNEVDGTIIYTDPSSTGMRRDLYLIDLQNKGAIEINQANATAQGTFENPGTIQLRGSLLHLPLNLTTARLGAVDQDATSAVRVEGILDNRNATLNLDKLGQLQIVQNGQVWGGRISGSNEALLQLGDLRAVTLDTPARIDRHVLITDGVVINDIMHVYDTLRAGNSEVYGGKGTILISGNSGPSIPAEGLYQKAGASITIGPELTVRTERSGGRIGELQAADLPGFVSLINQGHIVVGAGSVLQIAGRNWKNQGTITIEEGGSLHLGGVFDYADLGNIERNGQKVYLAAKRDLTGQTLNLNESPIGPLDLGAASFTGGRLIAPGREVLVNTWDSLVLSGTTVALDLLVDEGAAAGIEGWADLMLENARIRLKNGHVEPGGGSGSIMGTGRIVLDSNAQYAPGPMVWGVNMTSGVSVETAGSGGTLQLRRNEGTVRAATPHSIWWEYPVANAGLIEARDGGVVVFKNGGSNSPGGIIRAAAGGTIAIENGNTFINEGKIFVEAGGALAISGTLKLQADALQVAGLLTSGFYGSASGTLAGNVELTSAATTLVQIGGTRAGINQDQLAITGNVKLGGVLQADLAKNYKPAMGTSHTVLKFGSREGIFDSLMVNGAPAAVMWEAVYGSDFVSLVAKPKFAGDANLDGLITFDDYFRIDRGIARGLTGYDNGDFNLDGVINAADYAVIDQQLLQQGGPAAEMMSLHTIQFGPAYAAAMAGVPEPQTIGAAALLGCGLISRRWRR